MVGCAYACPLATGSRLHIPWHMYVIVIDRQCNNEVILMQNMDPAKIKTMRGIPVILTSLYVCGGFIVLLYVMI
jgi:hypothetical protein